MGIARRERAARAMEAVGLRRLLGRLGCWRGILTLNYHRIGDAAGSPFDPELFSASAEDFDEQVRFLGSHFDIIAPGDLERARRARRGRFVLITFDDGYIDNYTLALPVLRAHGTPATFFLATGLIDRPRVPWWDEIAWMTRVDAAITLAHATWLPDPVPLRPDAADAADAAIVRLNQRYRRLPPGSRDAFLDFLAEATGRGRCGPASASGLWMTWEMARRLRAAGMTIGGHTHEHIRLSEHPPEVQYRELETCLRRIEEEVGVRPESISYPYGSADSFDRATVACLEPLAVRYAFSYYGGYSRFDHWNPHDIPRIAVERYTSRARFRCMMACPSLLS